jgi:hypothetical protein
MKWNWGTKIALFYITFVTFTLVMVVMAFQEDYELVTEDYYEQEIKYQGKIDSKERTKALENKLEVNIDANELNILFPQKDISLSANILCFRPSDESKDFSLEYKEFTNKVSLPLNKFSKGKYLFKIDWIANNKSFYSEEIVIIP